jgi:hypothetical protein
MGADDENGTLQRELEQERKRHKEGMAALQAEQTRLEKENALMREREKKKPNVPASSDKGTGQESYGNFGKFIQALSTLRAAPQITFKQHAEILATTQQQAVQMFATTQKHNLAMMQCATPSNVQIACGVASHLGKNSSATKGDVAPTKETRSDPRQWSVPDTVEFLRNEGFFSYSEYFLSENMNGRMLLLVNESHLLKMPEQNALKQQGLLGLIADLKEMQKS